MLEYLRSEAVTTFDLDVKIKTSSQFYNNNNFNIIIILLTIRE